MTERPPLTAELKPEIFQNYYYLKEELVTFCRTHHLNTSGGKIQLTQRITEFLTTGETSSERTVKLVPKIPAVLKLETVIEENFVCTEKHRAFFKETIGPQFTFKVAFQKWLKANSGKTYGDAVAVFSQLAQQKPKKIDRQFEYNTYIRDFFADNQGKTLAEAILCWKYKKSLAGNNQYQKKDLDILNKNKEDD